MSKNQKERLRYLMRKYLNRTCSVEERNELVEMISKTSGPNVLDEEWREVWADTDDLARARDISWEKLKELSEAETRAKVKVIWSKVYKMSAVAATVLFCLYFVSDWWMNENGIIIYETGYGESLEIVLDDGTEVNLNADSKLFWENDWENNGVRKVTLEGEAYFDVSHIETSGSLQMRKKDRLAGTTFRMPFEVLTQDLTIRVLGTAFNASHRRGKTEVFLERGSVELALNRQDEFNAGRTTDENDKDVQRKLKPNTTKVTSLDKEDLVLMQPGEWVSYSSGEEILVQKTMVGKEETMEWKDGTLSYQDVEFRVMLQNLEDIYGKSFELGDQEFLTKRVNFSVPYRDWNTVKEMMSWMLGVEISELPNNHVKITRKVN